MLTSRHFAYAVALLALVGGGTYYYRHLQPASVNTATSPTVPLSQVQTAPVQTTAPQTTAAQTIPVQTTDAAQGSEAVAAAGAVRPLAEQHCAQLEEKAHVDACIERIIREIGAGKINPEVPTFDPEACNQIKDPGEQSQCHGRISQNFAVSTGNMKLCDAIPLDEFRVPCRTDIIVNEVKKLHALDRDDEGSIEP